MTKENMITWILGGGWAFCEVLTMLPWCKSNSLCQLFVHTCQKINWTKDVTAKVVSEAIATTP
jgi:hypothetical protein